MKFTEYLEEGAIKVGSNVIVNAGRFKNEEGVVTKISPENLNAYIVKFKDGVQAIIFPTDLKLK